MCCSTEKSVGCSCTPEGATCSCGSSDHNHEAVPCACHGYGLRLEGFVIPCLLMLLQQEPAHGYELYEKLSALPFLKTLPDPSVVYRQLRNMKSEGMVKSEFAPGKGGPARTVYSITEYGEEFLLACNTNLRGIRCMVDNYLSLFPVKEAEG